MAMTIRAMQAIVAVAFCAAALAPPAAAHVVLETREAPAGSYFKAVFHVPHGCEGAPTTAVRILLPPGVVTAKPMPKAGWTIEISRESLPQPVRLEGHDLTQRVREVAWQGGRLADDEFESFTIMLRLPDTPGRLYFPVRQVCDPGETGWVEIPPEGKTSRDVRHPAPSLLLTPPGPAP